LGSVQDTVFFSARWKEIFGYQGDEIGGRPEEWLTGRILRRRANKRYAVGAPAEPDAKYECEHRIRHRDGTYRWVLSRAFAVRDSGVTGSKMVDSLTSLPNRLSLMRLTAGRSPAPPWLVSTLPRRSLLYMVFRNCWPASCRNFDARVTKSAKLEDKRKRRGLLRAGALRTGANLPQVLVRIDPAGVPVVPGDADGIIANRLYGLHLQPRLI